MARTESRVAGNDDPARVFQWAQEHGPVGGVTRSVQDLSAALRDLGASVRYVDTGSAARAVGVLPRLWGRRSLHLFHITRLWRAMVLAPVFAVLPGSTVLVLHSGSTRGQLERLPAWRIRALRWALTAYDEIWAVNDEIRQVLPQRSRGRIHVVSPFVPTGPATAFALPGRDEDLVTVATNSNLPHYNADLAVEAVRLARRERPSLRLWILGYDQDGEAMARLRQQVSALPWVRVSMNLSPEEVSAALASSGVFLRPTSWDGDSVIVREALALGTRVVASDTVARPQGVEVAALDAASTAEAILRGGRPSDGAGLARESILGAARRVLGLPQLADAS
jgi:glycosyltransferase involved in cell wall biosynthesis